MNFVIATKNAKKLKELGRILSPLGISVINENDLGINLPEVDETGKTFEENAYLKAESACKVTGLPAIADDSGLCVDYLGGAPGIYSARYSGEDSNDEKNIDKLLSELGSANDRSAKFVSVVCCVFPDGRKFSVRGECAGVIGMARSGHGGFGYDPVFMVGDKSFADLTDEQKDKISHRGKALKKLAEALPDYL